ncbi:c-type cytochrome [Pseudomonas sp. LRF_L74]|uniref:c-type cytochrome n=1 Tax=Pseudomonas sp. LRF_L74 TaxID=3369422 RepID=UPI003F64004D
MKRSALLALLFAVQGLAWAEDGDPARGEALFQRWCSNCHTIGSGARAGFGPQLNGLIGRQAGSTEYNYSPAMRNAGIVWDETTLPGYIADPSEVVPDTKMRFWGISDEQKIADLLSYFATQR